MGYKQAVNSSGVVASLLGSPYFAPSLWNGDVWISYERKLTRGIKWRVQLNMRNALGTRNDIPVYINPDGTTAVIRVPEEKVWYLSNTFSF